MCQLDPDNTKAGPHPPLQKGQEIAETRLNEMKYDEIACSQSKEIELLFLEKLKFD